jgi:hypothetical protein
MRIYHFWQSLHYLKRHTSAAFAGVRHDARSQFAALRIHDVTLGISNGHEGWDVSCGEREKAEKMPKKPEM